MEEKADCEIEWHPGQIEEAERPTPGQKAPDLVEIAQGQQAHGPRPARQGQTGNEAEHTRTQLFIEGSCRAQQNAAAEEVEGGLPSVKSPGQKGECDEGGNAPARDDPVIDLEHVEGAREIEDVDERAEQSQTDQGSAVGTQYCYEARIRRPGVGT